MRMFWRRAKCLIFGHTYEPGYRNWVMCQVCGRQYKPLPVDWHAFRPDCTAERHTHDGPYSPDSGSDQ